MRVTDVDGSKHAVDVTGTFFLFVMESAETTIDRAKNMQIYH